MKILQKKLTLLTFTLVFTLFAMGAVSAAENSTDNQTTTIVDQAALQDNSVATDNNTETPASSDQSSKTVQNQTLADPQIWRNGVPVARGGHPAGYNFATIQDAINAAIAGDTIMLAENGVFHEYITVDKDLNFKVFNNGQATITGDGSRRVVYIQAGVTATFENITITDGYDYYAAGILNYGTLTLRKCTISNNIATYYASAVYNAGTLTLENCIINNNQVTGSIYEGYGTIWNDWSATLTMRNSILTNNQAYSITAGLMNFGTATIYDSNITDNIANNPYPGYLFGGGAVFNYEQGILGIYGSNLINNHAPYAGAVYSTNSNVILNFNRIVGNTQNTGPYQVYADNVFGGSPIINAEDNWWGSNNDPSGIVYQTDVNPWLYMTITANPTTIPQGKSSTLTASFNNHFNGTTLTALDPAVGHIPDGTPVTFTTNLGNVGSKSVVKYTVNGIATAILYADEGAGKALVTAFADNQDPLTAIVTITPVANAATTVSAKTIGMQETGTPLAGIALAIVMVLGGFLGTRKK